MRPASLPFSKSGSFTHPNQRTKAIAFGLSNDIRGEPVLNSGNYVPKGDDDLVYGGPVRRAAHYDPDFDVAHRLFHPIWPLDLESGTIAMRRGVTSAYQWSAGKVPKGGREPIADLRQDKRLRGSLRARTVVVRVLRPIIIHGSFLRPNCRCSFRHNSVPVTGTSGSGQCRSDRATSCPVDLT